MESANNKTVSHDAVFGTETQHPSFGQISLHRITGHRTLYGVDFPQGHFMELKISKSSHHRSVSNDWYCENEMIIAVAMSETQWAQLLCSPNTTGVPCTLADTNFPGEGYRSIKPVEHDTGAQGDLHKNEFKETAKDAIQAVKEARQKVEVMLSKPSVGKTELRSVFELLRKAEQEAVANLPFVIEQAGEAIEKAKMSAMGEVAAYIGVRLQQLGSEALAHQLLPGLTTNCLKESEADSVSTATDSDNASGVSP